MIWIQMFLLTIIYSPFVILMERKKKHITVILTGPVVESFYQNTNFVRFGDTFNWEILDIHKDAN